MHLKGNKMQVISNGQEIKNKQTNKVGKKTLETKLQIKRGTGQNHFKKDITDLKKMERPGRINMFFLNGI